jgi:hypothetical protein
VVRRCRGAFTKCAATHDLGTDSGIALLSPRSSVFDRRDRILYGAGGAGAVAGGQQVEHRAAE